MEENIERIFREEIQEKKRIGSGSFHMRGKGVKHGFSGALRTPYHFMKTKERNALNGTVEVSNVYTALLDWKEWNLKDKETQKKLMIKWREIYPNNEIMRELEKGREYKLNAQSFADIVNELGCPKKRRSPPIRKKKTASVVAIKAETLFDSPEIDGAAQPNPIIPTEGIKPILITSGLHLEYNGEYDQDELTRIFTKLQLLIDGETNKFKISLSLSECKD